MRPPYILALDIGTSSVRSGLYDSRAEVLPQTMVKNERSLDVTGDGGFEIDAEEAFAQAVRALDDLTGKVPAGIAEVGYAAVSCFWHSLLGIDADGRPTTPLYAWAETRPAAFAARLREELDERAVHNRTGCRFHSMYWPAKLLWLRDAEPAAFERTDRWISFSDYLALKFSGELRTSVSMASGTGLFDIRRCVWDEDLLARLEIPAGSLPPVVENDTDTFRLTDEYAGRWPLLRETEFFHAVGDGAGNNIGAGCASRDRAALMIGTSGAMRVAFAGDVPEEIPFGLWCYRIDRRRIILGGALSNGGGLYGWLKKNFRLEQDDDRTEDEIEARPPDGHGITFLPFLAGERSTGYHDFATGSILGLRAAHDHIDVVQAALEAVAYRFAAIREQLVRVVDPETLVASGGALRESPVWTQIIADTLGRDLVLPDTREASSRGVVRLAAEAAGLTEDVAADDVPEGRFFRCDPGNHEIYMAARKRHEKFYRMLVNSDPDQL